MMANEFGPLDQGPDGSHLPAGLPVHYAADDQLL